MKTVFLLKVEVESDGSAEAYDALESVVASGLVHDAINERLTATDRQPVMFGEPGARVVSIAVASTRMVRPAKAVA